MKKLIRIRVHIMVVIGCLFYLASNAQVIPKKIEGKPSYEETVEFIKTNIAIQLFDERGLNCGYSPLEGIYNELKFKIKELKFIDCVMEVRYVIEEKTIGLGLNKEPEIETFSAVIDFSKVESISWFKSGTQYCVIGMKFNMKGLNKGSGIDLPISRILCSQVGDKLEELQIFKAFDNLRKMCGAPEPIKF